MSHGAKAERNEILALIDRMSPKLRKTKGISRFYKSAFDISPIETKISKTCQKFEFVGQSDSTTETDIQHNF